MQRNNTNFELVICPECNGEGTKDVFNGDNHNKEICDFCNGIRVVKKITKVEYGLIT